MEYFVQNLLTPLILFVSVIAAFRNIAGTKQTARQKATLDLIERFESAEHYLSMAATFTQHRRNHSLTTLHERKDDMAKRERTDVINYLNHYELVAIGIANQVLDEGIYRAWMEGAMVRDWNGAADFIQRQRWKYDKDSKTWNYDDRAYKAYQRFVTGISEDAIKLDRSYGAHPDAPTGPGDEVLPKPSAPMPSTRGWL